MQFYKYEAGRHHLSTLARADEISLFRRGDRSQWRTKTATTPTKKRMVRELIALGFPGVSHCETFLALPMLLS